MTIQLQRIDYPDMVQVTAWTGKEKALNKWAIKTLGQNLPKPRSSVYSGEVNMLSIAPNRWLIVKPDAADLVDGFDTKAGTILDLSSARTLFKLKGENIERLLNKGCAINFDDFTVGSVAPTSIDHMGVLIHQTGDQAYDLYVFGTFAETFGHWITDSANDMKLVA